MSTAPSECQVLVVGAGPTGLVLAAQLLARGIRTRIADKSNGPAREGLSASVPDIGSRQNSAICRGL